MLDCLRKMLKKLSDLGNCAGREVLEKKTGYRYQGIQKLEEVL